MEQQEQKAIMQGLQGEAALTILRMSTGVILVTHGWSKLTDVSAWQEQLASMGAPAPEISSWFAIAGELLGGLGLLLGLLTPVAAFGAAATMFTAIALVHWGNGLMAANNGFEYPLTLLCVSLVFMLRGAGPFSLDALWMRAVHDRRARTRVHGAYDEDLRAPKKTFGEEVSGKHPAPKHDKDTGKVRSA